MNLNTLRRMNFAKETRAFTNSFANATPLFAFAPASPTNDGSKHKYRQIISVPVGTSRRFAGGYKVEKVEYRNEEMEIVPISHQDILHKDLVENLSTAQIAQNIRNKEIAMGNESAKVFEAREYQKYLDYARDNHNRDFYGTDLEAKLFDAGGTGSDLFVILFVTWKSEHIELKYNPSMNPKFKDGEAIFKKTKVADGKLIKIDDYQENGDDFDRFGFRYLYDTGIDTLLNDPRKITAIVNIESTISSSDLLDLMEDALEASYPETGMLTTMFYNNGLNRAVNDIKTDKLETRVMDDAFKTKYTTFNDAVLIKSRQMLKNQSVIPVS